VTKKGRELQEHNEGPGNGADKIILKLMKNIQSN